MLPESSIMKKMFGCTVPLCRNSGLVDSVPGAAAMLVAITRASRPAVRLVNRAMAFGFIFFMTNSSQNTFVRWLHPAWIYSKWYPVAALQQVAAVRCSAFAPTDGSDTEAVLSGIQFLAA